jgi:hypothetical protein
VGSNLKKLFSKYKNHPNNYIQAEVQRVFKGVWVLIFIDPSAMFKENGVNENETISHII